ncbi:MAG: glutamate 5-kinase, partial [Candidatus Hydrogenedentes bacterium]|nr:glutamate 5-kinase [Candidatus Hydrogenedentota bacterium]
MKTDSSPVKRLVIKIGTNLLTGDHAFEGHALENMVKEICALKHEGEIDILIVSSGAVGCGMGILSLSKRPAVLPEKQAVAAVGQARLMHYYETLFRTYGEGLTSAQVLLTQSDLDSRRNYLNVRNTLLTLFSMGNVIPIVNENDSTATEELRFGDNDTLAAKIAIKINADQLIILTDVAGLYDKNPQQDAAAELLLEVEKITPEIELAAGGAGSIAATGGMRTKLEAARIATAAGVDCIIASGNLDQVIHRVLSREVPCTRFPAAKVSMSHRKRWIAFGRTTTGTLYIDAGAHNALLHKGKSLLPAGIVRVEGKFSAGAAVRIVSGERDAIARGLTNYSSENIDAIKG